MSFSIFEDGSWDICCLLDACRYDTFQKINDIEGTLQRKKSVDSHTPGWIKKSIGRDHSDIVYISGNPFVSEKYFNKEGINNPFYGIESVWENVFNKDLNTVTAQSIIKSYSGLKNKYDDKRFFLHFMQPHHPFIGDEKLLDGGWASARNRVLEGENKHSSGVWSDMVRNDKISKDKALNAYESNLKYVIKWIKNLINSLTENLNLVITSDHGNLFGEYDKYGHPAQTYVNELVNVPYLKVKNLKNNYYPFNDLKYYTEYNQEETKMTDALKGLGYL